LPSWLPNISTTRRILLLALKQSIGSRRYGVLLVRHGPGSGQPIALSTRYFSAQSLTVPVNSGLRPSKNACR
jgi:hypothetical protein